MSSKDVNTNNLSSTGQYAVPVVAGDVLAGKYEVEQILGQGGMGLVVSAMHLQLRERIALKFLLPNAAQNPDFNARFLREAQVTAKLRNEHIVRVTDVGVLETGAPYMVMEYLQGYDLRQALKERKTLPLAEAIDFVLQACEGVAEAHALGIIHRDLKPSNIFVAQRRDGSALVKVLDFGISKANLLQDAPESELTTEGMMLGSPRYMSPEQLSSSSTVDARSDVWSLATILYELLAGKAPFAAESQATTCARIFGRDPPPPLREARPDVPEALEAAILHGLERDKDKRSHDVSVLAEEVILAVTGIVPSSVFRVSVERMRGMLEGAAAGLDGSQLLRLGASGPVPVSKIASLSSSGTGSGASSLSGLRPGPSSTSRGWATNQDGSWPRSKVVGTALAGIAIIALGIIGWIALRPKPEVSVAVNAGASVSAQPTQTVPSTTAPPVKSAVPVVDAGETAAPPVTGAADTKVAVPVGGNRGKVPPPVVGKGKVPEPPPVVTGGGKPPPKPLDPLEDRQ